MISSFSTRPIFNHLGQEVKLSMTDPNTVCEDKLRIGAYAFANYVKGHNKWLLSYSSKPSYYYCEH